MARKNVTRPYKLFNSFDMSAGGSSAVFNTTNLDRASIVVSWSGTSVDGEIRVMARNGESDTFRQLDFDESILLNVDNDYHHLIFNELPFTEIRLDYARTGGTGTLDATVFAKTEGA